jgi:metal-responsive CopG/Arc/MetJ family transcriptional regulator
MANKTKRVSLLLSEEVLAKIEELQKAMNHNTRTATIIEIVGRYYKEHNKQN